MSSTDFGVTVDDVKEYLPYSSGSITYTSEPLDNNDITEFIYDGGAHFTGLVRRSNISATSGVAQEQLAKGVKFYAVRECLAVMGNSGQDYERADQKVKELENLYMTNPSSISESPTRVRSNVDTSSTKRSPKFIGTNFEF